MVVSNARSLAPKMDSLIDIFENLDIHFAIISESWLKPGKQLELDAMDLDHGENLSLIHKSRPSRRGRTAGGGVAIISDTTKIKLTQRKLACGRAELVSAAGKLKTAARKIVVFGVYIPPRTRAPQVKNIMQIINDEVSRAKTEYEDPIM